MRFAFIADAWPEMLHRNTETYAVLSSAGPL
jgi:hypothetical protein